MSLEPAGFAGEINRTPWRSKRQASHLLAPPRPPKSSPVQSSPLFSSIAPSTTTTQCTLDTALICFRDTNYRFIRSMKTTLQIIPCIHAFATNVFFQRFRSIHPVIYPSSHFLPEVLAIYPRKSQFNYTIDRTRG